MRQGQCQKEGKGKSTLCFMSKKLMIPIDDTLLLHKESKF